MFELGLQRRKASGRSCFEVRLARGIAFTWMALTLAGFASCTVDENGFYERFYPCTSGSQADTCGTTRDGKPMTCVRTSPLGGQDFCVERCDPARTPLEANPAFGTRVCLSTGALLETCDPTADEPDCPSGLSCYRTAILAEQTGGHFAGLCMKVPVCHDDTDCTDPSRPRCGGQVLAETYPDVANTPHGNLPCVRSCPCPSTELCLHDIYDTNPKICVPVCNQDQPCPPNFYCYPIEGGSGYCAPGLIDYRCTHDEDCLLGQCVQTGAGFSVCTLPCSDDVVCAIYEELREPFLCNEEHGPGSGYCVGKSIFAGEVCTANSDCPTDKICSDFNPYDPARPRQGQFLECHWQCGPNGECPSFGSIRYTCLEYHRTDGSIRHECYPGDLGLPCNDSSQCLGHLQCLPVNGTKICTRPCGPTQSCDLDTLTANIKFLRSYCADGVCQALRDPGKPCAADEQCRSGSCVAASGTCE